MHHSGHRLKLIFNFNFQLKVSPLRATGLQRFKYSVSLRFTPNLKYWCQHCNIGHNTLYALRLRPNTYWGVNKESDFKRENTSRSASMSRNILRRQRRAKMTAGVLKGKEEKPLSGKRDISPTSNPTSLFMPNQSVWQYWRIPINQRFSTSAPQIP